MIPVVSHSAPEIGAYRWDAPAGPANIDGFSDWLGSAVTIASLFHGRNTWSEIEGQDAQLSAWSQWVRAENGRNVVIAIGMFPPGGSLASCAAGSYDANWRRLADNLAFHGLHWAYLRLGWQMESAGNEWAAPPGSGRQASYAGCFRRIVQAMRQEQPANQWKFVFNVGDTTWPDRAYLESVWPGDAYVDVVGVNAYDLSWIPNSYPYPSGCDANCRQTRQQTSWEHRSWSLVDIRNFAAAHGKPLAFPEWGMLARQDGRGGGDNTYFVQKMRDFFMDPANN
ncbi:MAG TPA: glycosyl hydrolase, partial [Burkholderiales bacterium]|nr:glycosyl hydrolase [Burkholderiales bacterium]